MAGEFKMHRAGPASQRATGVAPLGGTPKRPQGPARPAERDPGAAAGKKPPQPTQPPVPEIGGPKGPEPTRYGDWERNGICYDF